MIKRFLLLERTQKISRGLVIQHIIRANKILLDAVKVRVRRRRILRFSAHSDGQWVETALEWATVSRYRISGNGNELIN